jgi:hypothetical protein
VNDNGAEDENAVPRDAGDAATKLKWQFGCKGVLVIVFDGQGAHVGVSSLSPQHVREMACAAIHSSYIQEQQMQRPGPKLLGQ